MSATPSKENRPLWLGKLAVWHHTVPQPRARVILVHGISEHSGRHTNTFQFFKDHQIEVVRFDMRGAGLSGGKRQWRDHFHDVEDLSAVYQWVCRSLPTLPLFLMGHSLGGAISIHFAAEHSHELDGLILTAPAFRLGGGISPGTVFVGTWVNRLLPSFRLPKPLDMEAISRIPEVVSAYGSDPLVCHANTVHQGVEVLKGLRQIPSLIGAIQCPTVILHGSADRVIHLEGSYEILRGLGCAEKVLHVLPGGCHEPHNDLEIENFYGYLDRWLKRRLDHSTISTAEEKGKKPKKSKRRSATPRSIAHEVDTEDKS